MSSFYRTEPVGFADQPDFWNAVVEIAWPGTPAELLRAVREVESRVGRTRTFPNGPREIDVDILDVGGKRRDRTDPILPHPRLAGRRFVLVPLAEIRPDWTDPRSGARIPDLLERVPKVPRVTRIGKVGRSVRNAAAKPSARRSLRS